MSDTATKLFPVPSGDSLICTFADCPQRKKLGPADQKTFRNDAWLPFDHPINRWVWDLVSRGFTRHACLHEGRIKGQNLCEHLLCVEKCPGGFAK